MPCSPVGFYAMPADNARKTGRIQENAGKSPEWISGRNVTMGNSVTKDLHAHQMRLVKDYGVRGIDIRRGGAEAGKGAALTYAQSIGHRAMPLLEPSESVDGGMDLSGQILLAVPGKRFGGSRGLWLTMLEYPDASMTTR